jgi:hypothetical protein
VNNGRRNTVLLAAIAEAEAANREDCDNDHLAEATGLSRLVVGVTLSNLWSRHLIEGIEIPGARRGAVTLRGIRRVLPNRSRRWGPDGWRRC